MEETLITPTIRTTLTALYTNPARHCHSLSHVTALLALLSTHRDAFTDVPAAEAAIWFHDAIYDPVDTSTAGNELASAKLAVSMLAEHHPSLKPNRLERIWVMIEATASHCVPTHVELKVEAGAGEVRDAAMFLDMDLSILGAGDEAYDLYVAGVRREYAHVDEESWRVGRGKVLKGFLGRQVIYHTDLFRGLFEERARENLKRELAALESENS
ncbi:hypothetical protein QBC47DRAFT_336504 [Echria macrotheca]|uniref:HD domain-containing protein n=1 Tax=Echria macrotheca TaxID=438768 RepID=A0AAJ0BLA0_9PEZI|nr:hypothetical protein QBC47DRAFT_336504 [Echria macrotheca]